MHRFLKRDEARTAIGDTEVSGGTSQVQTRANSKGSSQERLMTTKATRACGGGLENRIPPPSCTTPKGGGGGGVQGGSSLGPSSNMTVPSSHKTGPSERVGAANTGRGHHGGQSGTPFGVDGESASGFKAQTELKSEDSTVDEMPEQELYRLLDYLYDGSQVLDKQHPSVTVVDQAEADRLHSSLLYGEILYPGVRTLLNNNHLAAAQARTLYDLGMGCGRFIMQSFLEYPNLNRVVGVELAYSRFFTGVDAAVALANANGWPSFVRMATRESNMIMQNRFCRSYFHDKAVMEEQMNELIDLQKQNSKERGEDICGWSKEDEGVLEERKDVIGKMKIMSEQVMVEEGDSDKEGSVSQRTRGHIARKARQDKERNQAQKRSKGLKRRQVKGHIKKKGKLYADVVSEGEDEDGHARDRMDSDMEHVNQQESQYKHGKHSHSTSPLYHDIGPCDHDVLIDPWLSCHCCTEEYFDDMTVSALQDGDLTSIQSPNLPQPAGSSGAPCMEDNTNNITTSRTRQGVSGMSQSGANQSQANAIPKNRFEGGVYTRDTYYEVRSNRCPTPIPPCVLRTMSRVIAEHQWYPARQVSSEQLVNIDSLCVFAPCEDHFTITMSHTSHPCPPDCPGLDHDEIDSQTTATSGHKGSVRHGTDSPRPSSFTSSTASSSSSTTTTTTTTSSSIATDVPLPRFSLPGLSCACMLGSGFFESPVGPPPPHPVAPEKAYDRIMKQTKADKGKVGHKDTKAMMHDETRNESEDVSHEMKGSTSFKGQGKPLDDVEERSVLECTSTSLHEYAHMCAELRHKQLQRQRGQEEEGEEDEKEDEEEMQSNDSHRKGRGGRKRTVTKGDVGTMTDEVDEEQHETGSGGKICKGNGQSLSDDKKGNRRTGQRQSIVTQNIRQNHQQLQTKGQPTDSEVGNSAHGRANQDPHPPGTSSATDEPVETHKQIAVDVSIPGHPLPCVSLLASFMPFSKTHPGSRLPPLSPSDRVYNILDECDDGCPCCTTTVPDVGNPPSLHSSSSSSSSGASSISSSSSSFRGQSTTSTHRSIGGSVGEGNKRLPHIAIEVDASGSSPTYVSSCDPTNCSQRHAPTNRSSCPNNPSMTVNRSHVYPVGAQGVLGMRNLPFGTSVSVIGNTYTMHLRPQSHHHHHDEVTAPSSFQGLSSSSTNPSSESSESSEAGFNTFHSATPHRFPPRFRCWINGCHKPARLLQLRRGNLFEATDAYQSDIAVVEVKIRQALHHKLRTFIRNLKPDARVLTYEDLTEIFNGCNHDQARDIAEHEFRLYCQQEYRRNKLHFDISTGKVPPAVPPLPSDKPSGLGSNMNTSAGALYPSTSGRSIQGSTYSSGNPLTISKTPSTDTLFATMPHLDVLEGRLPNLRTLPIASTSLSDRLLTLASTTDYPFSLPQPHAVNHFPSNPSTHVMNIVPLVNLLAAQDIHATPTSLKKLQQQIERLETGVSPLDHALVTMVRNARVLRQLRCKWLGLTPPIAKYMDAVGESTKVSVPLSVSTTHTNKEEKGSLGGTLMRDGEDETSEESTDEDDKGEVVLTDCCECLAFVRSLIANRGTLDSTSITDQDKDKDTNGKSGNGSTPVTETTPLHRGSAKKKKEDDNGQSSRLKVLFSCFNKRESGEGEAGQSGSNNRGGKGVKTNTVSGTSPGQTTDQDDGLLSDSATKELHMHLSHLCRGQGQGDKCAMMDTSHPLYHTHCRYSLPRISAGMGLPQSCLLSSTPVPLLSLRASLLETTPPRPTDNLSQQQAMKKFTLVASNHYQEMAQVGAALHPRACTLAQHLCVAHSGSNCNCHCPPTTGLPMPCSRLPLNTPSDRVPTSWAPYLHHRFHIYKLD